MAERDTITDRDNDMSADDQRFGVDDDYLPTSHAGNHGTNWQDYMEGKATPTGLGKSDKSDPVFGMPDEVQDYGGSDC